MKAYSAPKVYHRDVFWPKDEAQELFINPRALAWTRHAMDRTFDKRISLRDRPMRFDVIEIDETGKRTIRGQLDLKRDLVLVVREGIVITCWTNLRTDGHATLDKSKFETGE